MSDQKISIEDQNRLLKLARVTIKNRLTGNVKDVPDPDTEDYQNLLAVKGGTFVTLHRKGKLRGCIGNIETDKSVLKGVVDNAEHAAFHDTRFHPLTLDELADTVIEVSVLTPKKQLEYEDGKDLAERIRPGIDGVVIKKGRHSATFLPQVWEQLKTPQEFLSHLCIKAGLSSTQWQHGDLDVSVYQVQSFEEEKK